jgi:four helix bundle protein
MALGSASELQCHLLLARDLSYLNPRDHERLTEEVTEIKRMLTPFIKNLRAFAKQT